MALRSWADSRCAATHEHELPSMEESRSIGFEEYDIGCCLSLRSRGLEGVGHAG